MENKVISNEERAREIVNQYKTPGRTPKYEIDRTKSYNLFIISYLAVNTNAIFRK